MKEIKMHDYKMVELGQNIGNEFNSIDERNQKQLYNGFWLCSFGLFCSRHRT